MLNRNVILKGFNLWALVVCLFFVVFLTVFVKDSHTECYLYFIMGAFVLGSNHFILQRGNNKLGFVLYTATTSALMLIFDSGIMSPTRSFIFYIPLLLCNLIIINFNNRKEQLLSIAVTLLCISLTTFTDITPKLSLLLFNSEYQHIVSSFNTLATLTMTIAIAFLLSRSINTAQRNLIENRNILSRNEKLLYSINQNIDIAICRADVAANRLIYANNAKVKLFGYSDAAEMQRIPVEQLYKDEAERNRIVELLERDGFVSNIEVEFRRKDGSCFWGLLSSNKLQWEDGKVFYDGALRDISDIKKLQEELILSKESAERASLAKSQFLSTMSHEIRTPMNAVIGASNLLLEDEPTENQLENLLLLKSAGNNLMRLVNNILEFSKIELGKVEFEEVPIDLRKLLQEIVNTHLLETQKRGVAFNLTIDIPACQYMLDPIRLMQVLNNLVSNAVKFTEQGSVDVTVACLNETADTAELQFIIKDTGIGISEHRREKIFSSFYQENVETTRKYGGSGLGLAITRNILQKLGSSIQLETEKGIGSTFSFVLTLTKNHKPIEQRQNDTLTETSLEGMRILLVEDNKTNTYILNRFLEKWGVECDACESGVEAIELAKQQSYDLIMMDLHMPRMDGFEATRIIRTFDTETPIFALTADAFAETRMSALACGMNDFIAKPFDPEELFQKAANIR